MQHLAIFTGNHLDKILSGKKKIEARLSQDRRLPFETVDVGDEIFLKKSGCPVVGKVKVRRVLFYKSLNATKVKQLAEQYGDRILADTKFWEGHHKAKFATLIFLEKPETFEKPVEIRKKDRRAWILLGRQVLESKKDQLSIEFSQYDSWKALKDQVGKIADREDWAKYFKDADLLLILMKALGDLSEEFQGEGNGSPPRSKRRQRLMRDRIGDMIMILTYLGAKFDLDLYRATKQRLARGKRKKSLAILKKM